MQPWQYVLGKNVLDDCCYLIHFRWARIMAGTGPGRVVFCNVSPTRACERCWELMVGAPHGWQGHSILFGVWTCIAFVLTSFERQSASTSWNKQHAQRHWFLFHRGHRGQVCSLLWCSHGGWTFSLCSSAFILERRTSFLGCPHPSRKEGHLLSYPLFIGEKQFYFIISSAAERLAPWLSSLPFERTIELMLLRRFN